MGDSYQKIVAAVVQGAPVFLDREATTEKACRLISEAGKNGAQLVAFPESFIPGHPLWYHFHPATGITSRKMALQLFNNSVEVPGDATMALCTAARKAGVDVVMGICEKKSGTFGTMYNSLLFINAKGELVGKRQKLTPTVGERLVHTGGYGDTLRAFQMDYGKISGLICGESSNPLIIFSLIAEGAMIIVNSWPNLPGRKMLSRAERALVAGRSVAFMSKAFVLNCCGTVNDELRELLAFVEEDKEYLNNKDLSGGSSIINPNGEVIAGPMGPEEGIIYAELDLEHCVEEKLIHDFAGHYNRPDVFSLRINADAPSIYVRKGCCGHEDEVFAAGAVNNEQGECDGEEAGKGRSDQG